METIIFTCEVITPMFLAGADGVTPELRAPSIKGAMRFWWRAMHGHLPLKELKRMEGEIFGGTGDNSSRSKVLIRVSQENQLHAERSELVPHKSIQQQAFSIGQEFKVHLSLVGNESDEKEQVKFELGDLKALFGITCILGGLGKRARRGMGSINILNAESKKTKFQNVFPAEINLKYILDLISKFSPFYVLANDSINFTYSGRSERYGFIKQIQLGEGKETTRLLRTISNATHEVKQRSGYAYDPSMGYAFDGRYASPIYVSIIKGSARPIITTLNTAPEKNENQDSQLIQEDFKNRIL